MKRPLLFAILFLALALTAHSQCVAPQGYQCISDETVQRTAKALDELKAARDVIAKFESERLLNANQAKAADTLVKSLNDLVTTQSNVIKDYERISTLYNNVIDAQQALITKLTGMINKPRSKWEKFLEVVKEIAVLTLGITIGRGL